MTPEVLTDMRKEAMIEIMNICFGRASAALADLLHIFVTLNVPDCLEIPRNSICPELESRIGIDNDITVVQQTFTGGLQGEVLLILPSEAGKKAITVLQEGGGYSPNIRVSDLESEVFLEIGNIVIGAFLGQFVELLGRSIRYDVPNILLKNTSITKLRSKCSDTDGNALFVKTQFQLGEDTLTGFLFVIMSEEWLNAIYLALDQFIESMT